MTAYVNQPKNTYTKQTFVTNLTGYKFNPNAKLQNLRSDRSKSICG